jgi:enterochelin esterase-like enzyme
MNHSTLLAGGRALFFFSDLRAGSVSVTGSFCDWASSGVTLARAPRGFEVTVDVPPGDLTYKLVVDGRWIADPTNLDTSPDGLGGVNSLLRGDGAGARQLSFFSPALSEDRGYVLVLPRGYATSTQRAPLLVLLHGALDWERTWLDRGALYEELLALEGAGIAPIVACPKEAGGLYRGDSRVVDFLARDLVGHLDVEQRTTPEPGARALDGLSTGGFTSLVVGLERPDVFGGIGSMSGSFEDRAFVVARNRAESARARGQRLLLSCGLGEPHLGTCRAMFDELQGLGVDTTWADTAGPHDWPTWRALLGRHLRHHAATFAR